MESIKTIIVLLSALAGVGARLGLFMGTYWFGWLDRGPDTPFGAFVFIPLGAGLHLWLGGILAMRWPMRLPDE